MSARRVFFFYFIFVFFPCARNGKIAGVQYWKINERARSSNHFRLCALDAGASACESSRLPANNVNIVGRDDDGYRRTVRPSIVQYRSSAQAEYMLLFLCAFRNERRSSLSSAHARVTLKREPIITWQSLWSCFINTRKWIHRESEPRRHDIIAGTMISPTITIIDEIVRYHLADDNIVHENLWFYLKRKPKNSNIRFSTIAKLQRDDDRFGVIRRKHRAEWEAETKSKNRTNGQWHSGFVYSVYSTSISARTVTVTGRRRSESWHFNLFSEAIANSREKFCRM